MHNRWIQCALLRAKTGEHVRMASTKTGMQHHGHRLESCLARDKQIFLSFFLYGEEGGNGSQYPTQLSCFWNVTYTQRKVWFVPNHKCDLHSTGNGICNQLDVFLRVTPSSERLEDNLKVLCFRFLFFFFSKACYTMRPVRWTRPTGLLIHLCCLVEGGGGGICNPSLKVLHDVLAVYSSYH